MRLLLFVICVCASFIEIFGEKPCASRAIRGESVVCICNSTYCDEIIREAPTETTFVYYTSSKSGLRFKKTVGIWKSSEISSSSTLSLNPDQKYQTIEGFGGAVTDAAGINWKSLSKQLQQYFIRSYFSESGIEYNMARVPIGGCDFSTHPYAYNELPVNDTHLTNFTLAPEDIRYKIPMLKNILSVSKSSLHIVATTWSPPPWMKTNNNWGGFSRLKREFYQTYADYHLKFLSKYLDNGIEVWGITTTNEPINGVFDLANFNSLGWTISEMGNWISNYLGPTIRNSTFRNIKIIAGDDQRMTIPFWFNVMIREDPKVLEYIDGVGVHYYADIIVPAFVLDVVTKTHPEKFILATEACEGSYPWQYPKVKLGSWKRATSYVTHILEDLNHNVVGWIDWNLCLDLKGGPNWGRNFVDSPIIVDPSNDQFIKQPMFYAMGHFSKFIPRGSVRIEVYSSMLSHLDYVGFVTPRNTIVLVIYNKRITSIINVKYGDKQGSVHLPAESITTVELPY